MRNTEEIAAELLQTGFACTQCGNCCRRVAEDSNLVLVSPAEIRRIMAATGLDWDEVAEPYPEFFDHASGCRCTLAWCLRRTADACIFLEANRCAIYADRPWICRTYPFMLEGDALLAFDCAGIGRPMTGGEAIDSAADLIARAEAEEHEARRVERQYRRARFPADGSVVVDGEGVKVVHG